jgi:rhamnosyltransferase
VEKISSIGIVFYNPVSLDNLHLDKILKSDLLVIIYFNSDIRLDLKLYFDSLINKNSNVIFLGDYLNVGLSKAYNIICDVAIQHKRHNILLLDQDTIIDPDKLLRFIFPFPINENIACANIVGGELSNQYLIKNSGFIINNGNVLFLDCYSKIGSFNESYFVELVDYEFQFRLLREGYVFLLIHGTGIFNHILNQGFSKIVVLGVHINLKLYSEKRIKEYFFSSLRLISTLFAHFQFKELLVFLYQSLIQLFIIISHKILWRIFRVRV